ncbi:Lrp/AsnC family transcriptional regulator [Phenylobacterium sp. LH3H17]|uniref:Lrp/AsnC family transcriptional regulator n=1 Tax=Phenylobacterium sp. LH3H17 TaxID=2903901 RepID=UPI0020C9C119|nr:Lrp/AsnC family transcriptional regulator [Phenylobacterium sp. LH3H17]UTP38295.1 Lrp/AsnC family transcriptional regulator [Phenylobacterium sp. LH3H17]
MDMKILARLAKDGRISWRDLADEVGLSLTPVLRRVRRLESEGYITGYVAQLDESRLAGSMSVFVSVTLERQVKDALTAFEAEVRKLPQVMSCYLMTGGADYMLRVVVRDLAEYQALLLEGITNLPGVAHIQSSFALRPVLERGLLPSAAPLEA